MSGKDVTIEAYITVKGQIVIPIKLHRKDRIAERTRFSIIDTNWELTGQASIYKTKGNISYADYFATALAKVHNAELVIGDRNLKRSHMILKLPS